MNHLTSRFLSFLTSVVLLMMFNFSKTVAQSTAIPDPNFEQALIDMNIDSDGVVNGQVSTADIEIVTVNDFENVLSFAGISNLTGIQDFTNLEIFNMDGNFAGVDINENQADIFSNNINLREISITNPCGDCVPSFLFTLNISGLPNL